MDTKTLLFALFAVVLVTEVESLIRIQKFTCTVHDNTTVQDVKCFSKPVNRSLTLMNGSFLLIKSVPSVFITGELFKRTFVTYKPFLVNVTENYCDFFLKNRGGVYLRAIMKLYLPYSNLNHPCPYSGLVYLRDMPLGKDDFLSIWPSGEYQLDLGFSDDWRLIVVLHIFFEVK